MRLCSTNFALHVLYCVARACRMNHSLLHAGSADRSVWWTVQKSKREVMLACMLLDLPLSLQWNSCACSTVRLPLFCVACICRGARVAGTPRLACDHNPRVSCCRVQYNSADMAAQALFDAGRAVTLQWSDKNFRFAFTFAFLFSRPPGQRVVNYRLSSLDFAIEPVTLSSIVAKSPDGKWKKRKKKKPSSGWVRLSPSRRSGLSRRKANTNPLRLSTYSSFQSLHPRGKEGWGATVLHLH
ncbi:hypothetical protein BCV70DRAFT_43835 [Testicularia cyperi]|uniref:Secreted protein n=1 Tax=Testicularia cyperi TaxID=1882483 RepID=A0A317XIQ0_9BASI|nr:hypothetical protein BCV70DRAFT_43835 [Testicularia cyperi]